MICQIKWILCMDGEYLSCNSYSRGRPRRRSLGLRSLNQDPYQFRNSNTVLSKTYILVYRYWQIAHWCRSQFENSLVKVSLTFQKQCWQKPIRGWGILCQIWEGILLQIWGDTEKGYFRKFAKCVLRPEASTVWYAACTDVSFWSTNVCLVPMYLFF